MNIREIMKNRIDLIIGLLVFLFLGIIFLPYFQYIINSDGISYISIAREYINGQFLYAINGYWGPLYSWLLIPFLLVWPGKVQAVISTKILALFIGVFTIFGVYFLSIKFGFDEKLRAAVLLAIIPITLFFAFNFITPDLLVVCILIFYLNFLMDPRYCHRLSLGLLSGLAGGLAFLSKSYVFFFFIIHFALSNLYYLKVSPINRKTVLKNLLLGFLVFFVISGIWIGTISEKYGKITIGTSGSYNYALIGPGNNGHPMFNDLIKPPNPMAISAWEDPSYIKIKSWSPLKSNENFIYQLKVVYNNALKIINILESFSIFSLLIILFAVIYFSKARDQDIKKNIFLLLLSIIIYASGYTFILIEERYLWFISILLLLLGIYLVETIFKSFSSKNTVRYIIIFLLAWSFIIYPTLTLSGFSGSGLEAYNLAESLKDHGIHGNIASNDQWESSIYIVYYANGKYYGQTSSSGKQLEKELNANKIDYYLYWDKSSVNITGYEKVNSLKSSYVNLYKRIDYSS